MPPKECLTRLRRELQAIIMDPPQHIQVSVNESDMLEWHYLIEGPKDTPYFGGKKKLLELIDSSDFSYCRLVSREIAVRTSYLRVYLDFFSTIDLLTIQRQISFSISI